MTRFKLRFDTDGGQPVQTLDFEKDDGAFVFWLPETNDGREIGITADAKPLCRLKRSRTNKDLWIIRKP
ncbi:hypothetical protein [Alteriqipengyuania sp. 357]